MRKKIGYFLVHVLNITIIVTTFILAFITIFYPEVIKNIIEWIEEVVKGLGNWNYLIAFLSAAIESFPLVGMLLPGQTVLLTVGGFFGQEFLINVMVVAALGAVLGNYTGYILGYYVGDAFFKRYGEWFGIGETELDYIKSGIHKYGPIAVILSKFHPMTRAFIPFIAGSMGMKQFSFMIYNFIGSILWAVTVVVLGVLFVSYYEVIIDSFPLIVLVLLIGGAFYIYFFKKEKFQEYMKKKQEEIERKYGNK
ncbi:DedA family protein [Candidatus Absconditicoccus praedator]|uniref:DedA family protein n=1 Tax=Candidatus Absconditicoccus praedator TaxID=2735562 RepID=UPI001E62F1CC|nr:DedA family protein [Candidatus Absconditicoccus praedator]UFX83486.1 DedA family protein [Candidatus Absconditicoccus praedator]